MRTTLRTLIWEWGFPVLLVAVLVVNGAWSFVWPYPEFWWIPGVLGIPFVPIIVYWLYIIRRYPTRGDLPEWKKHRDCRLKEIMDAKD